MAISILSIKRTGTCAIDTAAPDETISQEYTVVVNQKTLTIDEAVSVTGAAWVWNGPFPLPRPFVTTVVGLTGILLCKTCKLAKRLEDGKYLKYQVTFDNKLLSAAEQSRQEQPNPILRTPVVNRSSQMVTAPVEKDLDDKPLVNTAGQKPVEPLMLEAPHETLTVECYLPAWPDFYDALQSTRTINSTAVVIRNHSFAAKTLWWWPVGIDDGKWENGIFFFTVRFEFVIQPKTWKTSVERLSVGFEHLIVPDPLLPSIKKLVKIKLKGGEEPLSQLMLKENGHCDPDLQRPQDAYYQPTNIFTEVDFNTAFSGGKLPGIDP